MPKLALLKTITRELVTRERSTRVLEPDLVMDDPDKVRSYEAAGRVDGVLAAVYAFHCAHITEILRPGDVAVDLGCGPANQLGLVARMNPKVQFTGVDLSSEMLDKARANVASLGVQNVSFRTCDISRLEGFDDDSVDAVFSTVALHHLPSLDHLDATLREASRILKPGGGLYIVDFGRMKSDRSMLDMATMNSDTQPELFTLDYIASLRAAFQVSDFRTLGGRHFGRSVQVASTFPVPFMVVLKTAPRREIDSALKARIQDMVDALPAHHRRDLKDLVQSFRIGGLRSKTLH